jgi:lipase chaperone LimK
MWGEESARIESSRKPYIAYTETLFIYSKDLSEMSDKQKQDKISEIRKSIFPPDVVQRLEAVDNQFEADKQRDVRYQKDYNAIINRNDISADEKNKIIRELQDKYTVKMLNQ